MHWALRFAALHSPSLRLFSLSLRLLFHFIIIFALVLIIQSGFTSWNDDRSVCLCVCRFPFRKSHGNPNAVISSICCENISIAWKRACQPMAKLPMTSLILTHKSIWHCDYNVNTECLQPSDGTTNKCEFVFCADFTMCINHFFLHLGDFVQNELHAYRTKNKKKIHSTWSIGQQATTTATKKLGKIFKCIISSFRLGSVLSAHKTGFWYAAALVLFLFLSIVHPT